jgi:GH24 family phage-related lysozyme (muramidase)
MTNFKKETNMKINEAGLAFIREAEGLRIKAYRDATGIWTIGYGHTSSAGAPEVVTGLEISVDDAERILAADVKRFAKGVSDAVTVPLNDDQFSALVSFAYNVGLGNFHSSSVLKAVNTGDFDAVPRRLGLWVKAGGKTLPGLVKRRAAEAALFVKHNEVAAAPIDIPRGKPVRQSTTIWAAALTAILAVTNHVAQIVGYAVIGAALTAGILAAAIWIIRERIKKSQQEGI